MLIANLLGNIIGWPMHTQYFSKCETDVKDVILMKHQYNLRPIGGIRLEELVNLYAQNQGTNYCYMYSTQ